MPLNILNTKKFGRDHKYNEVDTGECINSTLHFTMKIYIIYIVMSFYS